MHFFCYPYMTTTSSQATTRLTSDHWNGVKRLFFRVFQICIVNAMVVYVNKNVEFKKKKQSNEWFREILAHELAQSVLGRRSNRDYPMSGPGCNLLNQNVRLKEKQFRVSKHPIRICCIIWAYRRKPLQLLWEMKCICVKELLWNISYET